jgi:hypothetical protein
MRAQPSHTHALYPLTNINFEDKLAVVGSNFEERERVEPAPRELAKEPVKDTMEPERPKKPAVPPPWGDGRPVKKLLLQIGREVVGKCAVGTGRINREGA